MSARPGKRAGTCWPTPRATSSACSSAVSTLSEGVPVILIVVKFPVRPERAGEWESLAADYARAVNAEEGSLFFEWSRSLEEPDTFVCVEGFRNSDAGAAHVGTDAFKKFVDVAPDLVAAQPQIIYVDAPDVAGWGPMGEIAPRG